MPDTKTVLSISANSDAIRHAQLGEAIAQITQRPGDWPPALLASLRNERTMLEQRIPIALQQEMLR